MCLFFTDNKVDLIEVGGTSFEPILMVGHLFLMCLRSKKVQGYSNELTSPCCVCSTFGCVCVRGRVSLHCPAPRESQAHIRMETQQNSPRKKPSAINFLYITTQKVKKIFEMVVTIYRSFARRLQNF